MSKAYDKKWSFVAILSYILIFVTSLSSGSFMAVWKGFEGFLTGHKGLVGLDSTNFLTIVTVITAVMAINLTANIIMIGLPSILLRRRLAPQTDKTMVNLSTKARLGVVVFFSSIEELLVRGLFLGLLTKIPLLSGTVAFYLLLVLSNALWTSAHLMNYSKQTSPLRLLLLAPIFFAGLVYSYVFVIYGLAVAIMAHTLHNFIIFVLVYNGFMRPVSSPQPEKGDVTH